MNSPNSHRPLFIFAHGAGASSAHPWMQHWAALLATIGDVHVFDYRYIREGRRRPDPLPILMADHNDALQEARRLHSGQPILIGKSMGGRIGCHLSLEREVAAVICLGYPLCGGGDTTRLRDKVLLKMSAPVFFIQGTRDSLCPLELLERVRFEMRAPNEIYVVEGGDHSLQVGKQTFASSGLTQEDVDSRILQHIAGFISPRLR